MHDRDHRRGISGTLRAADAAQLHEIAGAGCDSLRQLAAGSWLRTRSVGQPGVSGPLRPYLSQAGRYVQSCYRPGIPSGEQPDGLECQDLMATSFPDQSFDLVVSSDIFEHIRRPFTAFAEIGRILKPGGHHLFSIPLADPMPALTVARVDTSGPEDRPLLPDIFHGDGMSGRSLVYTEFGADMLRQLDHLGLPTRAVPYRSADPRVPQGADIPLPAPVFLISFCNLGIWCSRYCLGVVRDDFTGFAWLDCDDFVLPDADTGATGLACVRDGVLVCLQSRVPRLVSARPRLAGAAHLSAHAHPGPAFGRGARAGGAGRLRCQQPAVRRGFAQRRRALRVRRPRGRARRRSPQRRDALGGAAGGQHVRTARSGRRAGSGAACSTSNAATSWPRRWRSRIPPRCGAPRCTCSARQRATSCAARAAVSTRLRIGGYLRGLAVAADGLVMGRSAWRAGRRRLGRTPPPSSGGDPHGHSWQRSALIRRRDDGTVTEADLSAYGPEMYDVLRLDPPPAAARLFHDAAHRRLDALQEAQLRLAAERA